MTRRHVGAILSTCVMVLSACAADAGVITMTATQTPVGERSADGPVGTAPVLDDPFTPASTPDSAPPNTSDTASTGPPSTTLPAILEPELFVELALADVVDLGDDPPQRDFDTFVAVALADVEAWLTEEFPAVYSDEFEPISGGIFAGYPERTDPIPGCGEPQTRYEDLVEYAAFYCSFDDFMVFDDGDDGLLVQLSDAFGPAVMGIVLAHEYGHAVQQRIGAFDDPLPTIRTEQQADCIAGAWAGRAYRGESELLRLGDRDLRSGLIAMVEVRDPVGIDQFAAGGHGSAFDRVGAFQEGFVTGLARCAELLDQPLLLMPNQFQPASLDEALEGNAAYDCSELPPEFQETCTDAPDFLSEDLNSFWSSVDPDFVPLNPVPVADFETFSCPNRIDIANEVAYCPDSAAIAYNEPAVLELYRDDGDFTLGYFLGIAWADVAQIRADSALVREQRALLNDCWTGAWVRDITPDDAGNVTRTDTNVAASPGDLDEAIQMVILVGDVGANVNIVGSPFEKIESFRAGVLGGESVCDDIFDITP